MTGGHPCLSRSTLNGSKTDPAFGKLSQDEPSNAEELTLAIAEAIQTAEELALTSVARGDYTQSEIISERLTPNLMQAKMYAEIAMTSAPEITSGIAEATAVASDLADIDPKYGTLLSALRRLREAVARHISP